MPGMCIANPFNTRPAVCQCSITTEHPIELTTGAKRFSEVDYETATGLRLRRVYSTNFGYSIAGLKSEPIGLDNWLFDFQFELQFGDNWPGTPYLAVVAPWGAVFDFQRQSNGSITALIGAGDAPQLEYRLSFIGSWPSDLNTLRTVSSQFLFREPNDVQWEITTFPNNVDGQYTIGRPTKMTDALGRAITFQYDTGGKLTSMTDAYGNAINFTWYATSHPAVQQVTLPGGEKLIYSYFDQIRLVDVKRYDAADTLLDQRSYAYDDADYPRNVTGVLDRDGVTRWAATYDDYGRATSSAGPGGVNATTVSYPSATSRVVTNAMGQQTTYTLLADARSARLSAVSAAATANVPTMSRAVGYTSQIITSDTDFEGRTTQYTNSNPRGLPTQIVEAAGTPQARTTDIQWDSHLRLPSVVTTPTLKTEVNYVAASGGGEPPPPTTTTHRYWRLKIIDAAGVSSTNYYANMAEVQMFEGAGLGDRAISAIAASSTTNSPTYVAAKANDGDIATVVSLLNGVDPPPFDNMYWSADFGAGTPRLIKAVAITAPLANPASAPIEFGVEWSDDAVTWSEQWHVSGQLNWHEGDTRLFTDPSYSYTGSFWNAHAYWRLVSTERASGSSGSFAAVELQYRATPGGANQAIGGTPTSQNSYSSSYVAAKAHDGLTTTEWVSQSAPDTWIQYQFTSAVSISEIRWTARSDGYPDQSPVAGLVLYSDNGTTWRPAFTLRKTTVWTSGESFNFTDPTYVP